MGKEHGNLGKDVEQVGTHWGWSQEGPPMPGYGSMSSEVNQTNDSRSYPTVSYVQPPSSYSLEHDHSLRGSQYLT